MRIVFDMDGTLVGAFPSRAGVRYDLNRKLVRVARNFKAQGHELVIWTFGNRHWWRMVRGWWPELLEIFTEVYTRDDLLGHMTKAPGSPEYNQVKDIRIISGDMLIDNDPEHARWAARHGLADRYITVETFGAEAA